MAKIESCNGNISTYFETYKQTIQDTIEEVKRLLIRNLIASSKQRIQWSSTHPPFLFFLRNIHDGIDENIFAAF